MKIMEKNNSIKALTTAFQKHKLKLISVHCLMHFKNTLV